MTMVAKVFDFPISFLLLFRDMRLVQVRNKAAASKMIAEVFIGRTKLIGNQLYLLTVLCIEY